MKRMMLLAATALATSLAAGPGMADSHKSDDPAVQEGFDAGATSPGDLTTADKADDSKRTDIDQQADAAGETETSPDAAAIVDASPGPDQTAVGEADTEATADASQQAMAGASVPQGRIISSLNTLDVQRLRGLSDLSADKVTVVSASVSDASEDAQGLDNAIDRNQEQISELRDVIEQNDALKEALESQDRASDDVVSAEIDGDNSVTLYTRD